MEDFETERALGAREGMNAVYYTCSQTTTLVLAGSSKFLRIYPTSIDKQPESFSCHLFTHIFGISHRTATHKKLWTIILIISRGDTNPYFQVDLGYADEIKGVATQGQEADYWFVRKFTLSFSLDGSAWFNYTENGLGTKVRETNILSLSSLQTTCLHSKFHGQFGVQYVIFILSYFCCQRSG